MVDGLLLGWNAVQMAELHLTAPPIVIEQSTTGLIPDTYQLDITIRLINEPLANRGCTGQTLATLDADLANRVKSTIAAPYEIIYFLLAHALCNVVLGLYNFRIGIFI